MMPAQGGGLSRGRWQECSGGGQCNEVTFVSWRGFSVGGSQGGGIPVIYWFPRRGRGVVQEGAQERVQEGVGTK